MKKLNFSDFIKRSQNLYGDKYDYSKVDFVNTSTKICIVCPDHGDFFITPNNFLKGHKCPACSGRTRVTKDVFITRAAEVHSGRYDYSKVEMRGRKDRVCIICPVHGEFWQKADYHLNGCGCPKCYGTPKSTRKQFVEKAIKLYGDKYNYSKVEYKGNKTKICIICPIHGEWWMTPNNFLRGHSCPGCFGTPKYTTDEFIEKARIVHGDKYDYSKVEYDGNKKKVCIICPKHGDFWQIAASHMHGSGCPKCVGRERITLESFISRANENHSVKYDYSKVEAIELEEQNNHTPNKTISRNKITQESFIERSSVLHSNKYDYSKTKYISHKEKVCIICPKHGDFWQNPHFHLQGGNCPKCVGGVRLTTEEFIEKAKLVHKDRYNYSKVKYKNTASKICIICHEHGEFWQTPNNHLFGAGCPTCPQSNLEGEIRQFLIKNNIEFEQEKSFSWLVFNKKMFLDFFLPEYGVAIECQGGQHFFPTKLFGGQEEFKVVQERDRVKKELCEKNGITILYFSNAHIDYPYPVFESQRLLLSAIKKHGKVDAENWKEQFELPFNFYQEK